jgi:hypothetical protein
VRTDAAGHGDPGDLERASHTLNPEKATADCHPVRCRPDWVGWDWLTRARHATLGNHVLEVRREDGIVRLDRRRGVANRYLQAANKHRDWILNHGGDRLPVSAFDGSLKIAQERLHASCGWRRSGTSLPRGHSAMSPP